MQNETPAANEYTVLPAWSTPVRVFGQVVSFLFHPLFLPSYITAFLLYADPYAFAGMSEKGKIL